MNFEKEQSKLTQNLYQVLVSCKGKCRTSPSIAFSPVSIPAAGNTELSCCPGLAIAGFSQLFVASLNIITFSFLLPLVLWVGQNKMAEILAVRVRQGDEKMGFFTIRNCPIGVFYKKWD